VSLDLFEAVSLELEEATDFDKLEARGTVRLALKAAGLDVKNLTFRQLEVVFDKLMPEELSKRGIGDAAGTCASVMQAVSQKADLDTGTSSDDVFSRLGGD